MGLDSQMFSHTLRIRQFFSIAGSFNCMVSLLQCIVRYLDNNIVLCITQP